MLTSAHVQASVVDIGNPASALPSSLVADANILYWIFYPNFSSLAFAGGRGPLPYQTREYPAYWARVARNGCVFHTATATIGEFAKVSEYAEMEAVWLTDPAPPQPDPANPSTRFDARVSKCARYHYAAHLLTIRSDIETIVRSMLRSISLLDPAASAAAERAAASTAWLNSLGDFPDAMLVSSALSQGVDCFLSDDSDFATFSGTTLYTANRRIIHAARAAGKLL